ncbi:MAG TPA: class A beta-lactamase-related serine hydrolase [Chitinophagales bacterium]|nr:class A beta-lactamase-related serine hydrolase [Chitinophagales bacterium]
MKKFYTILLLIFISSNCILSQTTKTSKPNTVKKITSCTDVREIRTGGYNFINPLLDYYDVNSSNESNNKLLQRQIKEFIAKEILSNNIQSASVYYRDLVTGYWIGINENEVYSPASLLKVPYLIAALKYSQDDPTFLAKQDVFIPKENEAKRNITDSFSLIPGNLYSMEELLTAMIIHSDNDAKDLLVRNIPYPIYKEIFDDLNIDIQKFDSIGAPSNFLSVKQYASFFRILYNATFLNNKMSEYALWLLANTTYNDGIKAGIPTTVKLSHKFGERFFTNTDTKQLHDCGIIYKDNQPYILCVMTKGKDLKQMTKTIASISKLVYTHLDKYITVNK